MKNRFRYIRFTGIELSPEKLGREPSLSDIVNYSATSSLSVKPQNYISISFPEETLWLSEETYKKAKNVFGVCSYEAHEGVGFGVAKGAWLIIGEPQPVSPPLGVNEECVRVETKLSRALGLPSFIIEKRFVFKGFKGEDIDIGRIKRYRYFIAAYDRSTGQPLTESQLGNTLLWKNYLSNERVLKRLGASSKHLKKDLWELERMSLDAMSRYKVVWRDVAKRFIPAVVTDGAVPEHTAHYIVVNSLEEAYYLSSILLAPQINAVINEISPWVGHVEPRFIKFFRIPKYDPKNSDHKRLAEIGREICGKGEDYKKFENEIEGLVSKL
ncbi:hypothetical protein [Desulfurococcus mucosus]|uniref:Uncharacterized protein n=1 Tax=Desulfurococcus mucosus (strain ATCC 35584 / DSM 2162 / JCM 9187 / O7/1) TaxID=765177 RepID=E8R878_DESM0|nr:hypothetical protein [Desulfurococcus mucosus]ADV64704.1 hypothetical protein Desmu_0385 [Desulfurococcus mucosus DSM 2162]